MRFINLKTMTEETFIPADSVLCLGNFDGVHLGHRQLVDSVLDKFETLKINNKSIVSGAWFFDSSSYKLADEIYSLDEKLSVFADLGLDYAIIADFEEMKSLSPNAFVKDVLKNDCRCIHAVCGENFRFGSQAAGNSNTLKELMDDNATIVPLLSISKTNENGELIVVSSTYIRSLLACGAIEKANELLGTNYSICEEVVHGKALGRTIGIPTINQYPINKKIILSNGIYATVCTIDGKKYCGVTNVGTRPTVDNNELKNIETHIVNFNSDCYGKSIKVEFLSRIRDEKKFDGIDKLKNQIQQDIEVAKTIYSKK